ncbi:MAG: iron-containing redox enzyme family protein [Aeromicrobium sp.]
MLTPKGRGSLSEVLFEGMRTNRSTYTDALTTLADDDADLHISLWALYEMHYRGFDDVDDSLEWHPELIELRRSLESAFEQELRDRQPEIEISEPFAEALFDYVAGHDGASLAAFVQREATTEQVLEIMQMRTIYHLKEADPTAFVVPRLSTGPKAALMELQYDEYGGGSPVRLHSAMFTQGLEAMGLRTEYGAYIDDVPAEVLQDNNAMSLFALNRRLRGASLGHLAAFEATSSLPSRRMAQGLQRLGLAPEMIDYYTEHVEADAVHEQLAVRTICGALVADEPWLAPDVFFGAFTCLDLEDRFARRMLDEWAA